MKTLLLASIGILAGISSTVSLASVSERHTDRGVALLSIDSNQGHQLAWDARKADESMDSNGGHHSRRNQEKTRLTRTGDGVDRGMQAVLTAVGPGQPGDGWLYFSDPAAGRAVVITPQGDYFLSRGKGLRLVAVTQPR